ECQQWTESNSDEDSDTDDILSGVQSCATDLHHHPQLGTDIEAVRTLFSDSAVSVRRYGSIDDVDVDLNINANFLDAEAAKAWRVNPSEPIVIRLHFSVSQYLDGPAPTVEVFQPSNPDHFSVGKQLQNILTVFISQEWKHLTNESVVVRQKSRHSWFKPSGTMKKFRARFSVWLPQSKYEAVMRYAEQRIPTLNEYCVACDERHVFQNGPMLKPAVCTRELCVFSFHTLGVMSGATEDVATGAEVIDLLVAMCKAALQSSRKSIIFEPYPSVVDPYNPKTLAFSPKRKSYDRLQKALDSILLIRRMAQGSYSEIKKQMDKADPLAHPLLQWILASNRSHLVKLPLNKQLKFMHTPHQFLLISSPPSKEARFQTARKFYGSTFAFHGSHIENWHSILRNGLVNASYTKLQLHGAAYGKGIYLSPISSISFGYSGKNTHILSLWVKVNTKCSHSFKFLQSSNLNCIALCEVITSKDLQKHGNIWVCPIPDHVCTRFLFVYENGQVGDVHINTQEATIQREILQVIASKPS
uniref:Poly [ADP-ribose] polymerase n=1 Tax=Amphiprion ocellaris TaxID=80972 RepID=A0AAQ5X384_AMPOC